jgi:hypothetical protein
MSASLATARSFRGVLGVLALALLVGPSAQAAAVSWDGSDNRNWNNTANWSTDTIPTLADDVDVPNNAPQIDPIRIQGTDAVARTLAFGAGANTVTLQCTGGTNLTIAGNGTTGFTSSATTATNDCPTTLTNGQISVDGTLSLTSTLTTTTLTKSGTGTLNIDGAGTIGSIALNAGTIVLGSTLAGTTVAVASGATLAGDDSVGGAVTVSWPPSPLGRWTGTFATGALTELAARSPSTLQ